MGYSGRYHAASLAAVFLALAVGLLIGVGFGSDVVDGTAQDIEDSLRADLDDANAKVDDLEADLAAEHDLASSLSPAVVENRLRGREIAVVSFGDLDDSLTDGIRAAINPSGARLQEIAVVREPPDDDAAGAVGKRRNETREEPLARAARQAGKTLVTGGENFDDLRSAFLSRYSGEPGDIDGVVVVRDRPADLGALAGERRRGQRLEEPPDAARDPRLLHRARLRQRPRVLAFRDQADDRHPAHLTMGG